MNNDRPEGFSQPFEEEPLEEADMTMRANHTSSVHPDTCLAARDAPPVPSQAADASQVKRWKTEVGAEVERCRGVWSE